MSGLEPLIGGLSAVVGLANSVQTLANGNDRSRTSAEAEARQRELLRKQQQQTLQQVIARQELELTQDEQEAQADKQKIQKQAEQFENERRSALRRAVARQKAQFSGRGIAFNDGSGEAVLLGLFDESDAERKKREDLDQLRTQALESDLAQQRDRNLLEQSQLAERQRLQFLSI